jgi:sulfopyruvate decarboxylase subunit alpha
MTQQSILSPEAVIQEFKKNGITHVVYLPDSETNWMYQLMEAEPSIDLVSVTREGETIAIAAGIIAGGKKPVVLIQNTGLFESGDSIRGIALDCALPVVMLIG